MSLVINYYNKPTAFHFK